jgi:hypothetical protein
MAISDFGVKLSRGDGATPTEAFAEIAEVTKLDNPEFLTEYIESTPINGPKMTKVWSGKTGMEEFKATISYAMTEHKTLMDDLEGGVIHNYQIEYPTKDKLIFSAGLGSYKLGGVSGESHDVFSAEVTFVPTGTWEFTEFVAG